MNEPRKRMTQRIRLEPAQQTQLIDIQRRSFLRAGLTVGAMSMLTGCNLQDGDQVDKALWAMSRWNDRVQAWLFNGQKLAPTYSKAQLTNPFPFNAFYPEYNVPELDLADYRLAVSGLVRDKQPWTIEALRKLPQRTDITRLICIEGWSAIGQWGGVPLKTFLEYIGADTTARFVGFKCADRYYSSLDMPTALHRRRCWRWILVTWPFRRITAIRCACGCRPSWASRTPNTSSRYSSATRTRAGIGRIRGTTGSAGSEDYCGVSRCCVRVKM